MYRRLPLLLTGGYVDELQDSSLVLMILFIFRSSSVSTSAATLMVGAPSGGYTHGEALAHLMATHGLANICTHRSALLLCHTPCCG